MFATQYYCLVASLKEYALDADTKGFDARAIVSGILEEVNRGERGARRTIRWATSRARSWRRS